MWKISDTNREACIVKNGGRVRNCVVWLSVGLLTGATVTWAQRCCVNTPQLCYYIFGPH